MNFRFQFKRIMINWLIFSSKGIRWVWNKIRFSLISRIFLSKIQNPIFFLTNFDFICFRRIEERSIGSNKEPKEYIYIIKRPEQTHSKPTVFQRLFSKRFFWSFLYFIYSFSFVILMLMCIKTIRIETNKQTIDNFDNMFKPFYVTIDWYIVHDYRNHLHQQSDSLSFSIHLKRREKNKIKNKNSMFSYSLGCWVWMAKES